MNEEEFEKEMAGKRKRRSRIPARFKKRAKCPCLASSSLAPYFHFRATTRLGVCYWNHCLLHFQKYCEQVEIDICVFKT